MENCAEGLESSVPKNYQHVLALAFAVQEINENPSILPNITLGFRILNCYFVARTTYKATLSLPSTQLVFVPNFKCNTQNKLVAVIAGLVTETTANAATITSIYKLPQNMLHVADNGLLNLHLLCFQR
ncbi:hypothetical protein lerEdw1_020811 [Lerista edwardsae]|nr:hypothetical protein lerEdw1_020811 [Lerista edwardsae]